MSKQIEETSELEQKGNLYGYIETRVKKIMDDLPQGLDTLPFEFDIHVSRFFGHDDFVTEVKVRE